MFSICSRRGQCSVIRDKPLPPPTKQRPKRHFPSWLRFCEIKFENALGTDNNYYNIIFSQFKHFSGMVTAVLGVDWL